MTFLIVYQIKIHAYVVGTRFKSVVLKNTIYMVDGFVSIHLNDVNLFYLLHHVSDDNLHKFLN